MDSCLVIVRGKRIFIDCTYQILCIFQNHFQIRTNLIFDRIMNDLFYFILRQRRFKQNISALNICVTAEL